MRGLICYYIIGFCLASPVAFADVKDDLQKRGVRISASSATLASESEVASRLKDVTTFRRKLSQATSQYDDHKKADLTLDVQITRLNQQLVGLNAQLANVQDTVTNNRLVGAIGAVEGQLRLIYESRQQRAKQESTLHEQISVARDGLISHIVDMRNAADDVARQYYAADKETLELIAQLNKDNGSSLALSPSSVFLANLRKLEDLEDDILAEDIKLKREGNTYWASVKINGEQAVNMVVDSGAAIVLLPFEDAAKAGITPGKDDPVVKLGVADGRSTTGRKMTIKSMQLGRFTVENVECVVLNAGSKAEPLLGMTFLGQFKFQLDGGKSTLSLTRVKDSAASSERPSRNSRLPPLQLIRSDWELVPAATDIPFWADRPYKIKAIPEELKNTSLVRRKIDDPDWLSGEIIAHEPVDVSVAIRSDWHNPKIHRARHDVDEATLTSLKSQGWKQIAGFAATALPQEHWKWVLLQKRIEPGPITIPALIPADEPRVLFFLKPAAPSPKTPPAAATAP